MARLLIWLANKDSHHRLALSLFLAGLTWFAFGYRVDVPVRCIAAWDAFALCILGLEWVTIVSIPQEQIRARARKEDFSRTLIFMFVIFAACAGLSAVGFLFYANKTSQPTQLGSLLSFLAVISSWALVHTVFALRYAHAFYGGRDGPRRRGDAGGLKFPGEAPPDYADFAYFSFVIGMTFQVSDVQITSRGFRRLVLLHGILSFGFNTIILALTINTVSSLI